MGTRKRPTDGASTEPVASYIAQTYAELDRYDTQRERLVLEPGGEVVEEFGRVVPCGDRRSLANALLRHGTDVVLTVAPRARRRSRSRTKFATTYYDVNEAGVLKLGGGRTTCGIGLLASPIVLGLL